MKTKILSGAILAALLSTTALADTSSINSSLTTATETYGILENDYVKAGVNGVVGTFGSGHSTSPGLLYDSTGTGTFNTSYDYLTPGTPFDGFSVMVDGTNYTNNNAGSGQISPTGGANLTNGDNTLSWTGGVASVFDITNTYTLGATSPYIDISSQITMGTAATDVYFGRFIDPDARAAAGDSSSTDNVLGYGVIPDSNVAFSEALSSRYALGLYSTDSNVDAGITGWTTGADSYTENAFDSSSNTNTGDNTIGLSWHWSSVASGDILTASYAYIFGPSAFDAADDAITGGAGGGADISSWGTLTDVGSATDAASGTSTPTLVSTSDPVITYGAWGAWTTNTALPVLTQTQTTHDASETATIQTIDRETTTIVTTPEKRTRTTTTTVTDTYSDSSTIDRVTATGTDTGYQTSSVTTVTDPGSFTGRIDQVATVQDVVGSVVRTMDFENIEGFRTSSKMKNGMSGNTNGVVVAGNKQLENGVALSGGFTRMGTSLAGNDDTVSADTDMLAVGVANNGIKLEVRHAMTDYEVSRTIGDFANTNETSGTDTSARIMYSPDTGKVNPVIGYTRGKKTVDGYTETGSIQSARTVADSSEMYGYGTVGLRGDLGLVDFTVMHHTDGVNDVALGLEKEGEKFNWRVEATRSMTNLGDTNSLSAGISWKF